MIEQLDGFAEIGDGGLCLTEVRRTGCALHFGQAAIGVGEFQDKLRIIGFTGEARYRAAYGGRGSAKSRTFAKMLAVRGYQEPIRILCARELQNSIKDSSMAEIIKAIQKFEHQLPHFNVRYMPFCFLPGYEQYVTNLDQMTFDPDEWDNYASIRIRKGWILANLCALLGWLNTAYLATIIRHGIRAMLTAGMSRFYILKDRIKTKQCKRCAYEHVCDYIYEHYLKIYGDGHIVPITGEKIRDPAWKMVAARVRKPGELPLRRPYPPISEKLKRELVS